MADKESGPRGPGLGDYPELDKVLPEDYSSLLSPKDTQRALFEVKGYIERNLCKELNLPRKQRETAILQRYPAVFIIGIGWMLKDGYPHELRAADYDDWVTPTIPKNGHRMHGLNGDILVWNPVTRRRHELSSMGIRVNAESLKKQLELTHQLDFLKYPYHRAIVNQEIPLSIGGGIGQSRTLMLLLRKAHLGEVSVKVCPKVLKEMCAKKNIHVLN